MFLCCKIILKKLHDIIIANKEIVQTLLTLNLDVCITRNKYSKLMQYKNNIKRETVLTRTFESKFSQSVSINNLVIITYFSKQRDIERTHYRLYSITKILFQSNSSKLRLKLVKPFKITNANKSMLTNSNFSYLIEFFTLLTI